MQVTLTPSSQSASRLGRLGLLLTAKPWLVVGIWIVLVLILGFEGRDFGDSSKPHVFYADGSPSLRAHDIAERRFGDEEVLILMLRGPAATVNKQGRRLAASLATVPGTAVISPWPNSRVMPGLTPKPGVAAMVVRLRLGNRESPAATLRLVRKQVDGIVGDPVQASIAGLPVTLNSFQEATEHATRLGELIAIPVLLVVLLLVFRSVVAAAVPIVSGGMVVLASRGVLSLISNLVQIDSFALGVVSMLGLALGVDYSLLVVSRYREDYGRRGVVDAVRTTVTVTARSILPAGVGLILAGLVVLALNPTPLITSVGLGVVVVTLLSVVSSICVVPAALMLLGNRLDRWALPRRERRRVAPVSWIRGLVRRRAVVIGIAVSLLLLAAWAPTLNSTVSTPALLPGDDPGRLQQEDIEASLGAGWVAPFEVLVDGIAGPVTSPDRLEAMAEFQRHAEGIRGVEAVAGLGAATGTSRELADVEKRLTVERQHFAQLDAGLGRASHAADLTARGIKSAAGGASRLADGVRASGAGAGLLVQGLGAASKGSDRLSDGLGRAQNGSSRLSGASTRATNGAGRLSVGLRQQREDLEQIQDTNDHIKQAIRASNTGVTAIEMPVANAEVELTTAWQALEAMNIGRGDPQYDTAARAIAAALTHLSGAASASEESAESPEEGVRSDIARLRGRLTHGLQLSTKQGKSGVRAREHLEALTKGTEYLHQGLGRLTDGSERLTRGLDVLSAGGQALSPAVAQIAGGTEHLQGALHQLSGGAATLAGGLADGSHNSDLLADGVRGIDVKLNENRGNSALDRVHRRSPGLFQSGYFVLAGLDGGRQRERGPLSFLVALDGGGLGARMLVVPRFGLTDSGLSGTRDRLEEEGKRLAQATGAEVAVGGLAGSHLDIDSSYQERIPLTRIALALVTMLVLLFVIRSLTMAIVASLLNLITVAATFGLLSVLFNDSFLGGPGYVDTIALLATVMLTFGLAADYETFVFARMREEYERTGSPHLAVDRGLDRVAPVITGAAVIMIAVFLAFSVSPFISMRNLGVAQAIGIAIDAFIVRLVLIPAVMHMLGDRAWWIPGWMDQILPGGNRGP